MTGRRTALVIVVPAAEPLVAGFRRRHDADAVARRIPPHVTIVFPFAPVETVDDRMVDDLETLYASSPAFDFELTRVGRFEEHVWLAPEPQRCFARLIELTAARFPEWPPYKGSFGDVVPHLTIGSGESIDAMTSAAREEIAAALPVSAKATGVTLLEEQADGTWAGAATFRLGVP